MVTSCRSESRNIGLVVLDKMLFGFHFYPYNLLEKWIKQYKLGIGVFHGGAIALLQVFFFHTAGKIGLNLKVGIHKQGYLRKRSFGALFKSRLWHWSAFKLWFNYLWTNKNRMSNQSCDGLVLSYWWSFLQAQRPRVQSPNLIIVAAQSSPV